MKIAVGIDIGGTNTVWGFIDEEGKVYNQGNFSTVKYSDPADFVREIALEIKNTLQEFPNFEFAGIGIGAPNGNYFKGTIEYPPNLIWDGIIPFKAFFQTYFEVPIWLTNDANAAAIGEMQFGVAKGMRDFVVVTLGTGLGSGFVANNELIYGHDAFAGELGHTIIERGGRLCGCGRNGCLETYASATGLVQTANDKLKDYKGKTLLTQLNSITSKGVATCAEQGDALALEIFDFTGHQLGFSLANTVAISSPEAIILFGGLANAGELILQPTRKYMEQYMLNLFKDKVKLLVSKVPEQHAAILGAAALVWKNLEK